MILVDTSIWITGLSRGDSEFADTLRQAVATGQVAVPDLVLMELLRGAESEPAARRLHAQMAVFPILQIGGAQIAVAAASHYRSLRALGITVRSTIDAMLAAYCIRGRHRLLHRDRDFDHFTRFGLVTYEP